MSQPQTVPGFDSPAVGFEQPFEMLEACHSRVQRSLALLEKLLAYVQTKGHDEQSRSAAADVLRYFDLAAPLHHADEELNIFPIVLTHGNATAISAVESLQRDHQTMHALWQRVREVLTPWSLPGADAPVSEVAQGLITDFVACYGSHIRTEEDLVYPQARALMSPAQIADISQQMRARRQG
ncbi:MAG: hemerythrin domain-containing protein [Rhodoferax sp.]|nr:hemerythrin domain-containing protein [Rhodoferax sp.]